MKRVLIVLLLLALIAGGVGYYQFNRKVPTLEEVEAEYVMTADELYLAFEKDEKAALAKYEGKVILVTGKIAQIEDTEKKYNVTLFAENAMMGGVNCSLNQKEVGIKVGDQVEIKGRCQGYLMNVVLNNCIIINE